MARGITFDTVATGTLEDRGSAETWMRIALTSPGSPAEPHCALQLSRDEVTLVPQAYQAMWDAVWDP